MLERLRRIRRPRDPVVQEWEWYARNHRRSGAFRPLGEEWNSPAVIGMASEVSDVVAHLENSLIEPFIGSVGTILEIGAGGGRFTEALARHAQLVIAGDSSPTMLRLLHERFGEETSIKPRLLNGHGLAGIDDASIDAVFSYDVFVHLSPWTTFAYLEETRRVLKPEGRAVIHHANTLSELGWKRFLRDLDRVKTQQPPSAQFMPMTPELMAAFGERAGLSLANSLTSIVSRDCISVFTRAS